MDKLAANAGYFCLLPLLLCMSGCGDHKEAAGQSVAIINDSPITAHQFETLTNQTLSNSQTTVSLREVANKLISQELAIQEALKRKLDRRPDVLDRLELARREVLAGAYADFVAQTTPAPTFQEIKQFYSDQSELFSKRKIYQLKAFRLPLVLRENADFVATLKAANAPAALETWLKQNDFTHLISNEIRYAEQLPIAAISRLATASENELVVFETDADITIYNVLSRVDAPISQEQAHKRIENYLRKQKVKEQLEQNLKALRMDSKIELFGEFAELAGTPSAP